MDEKRLVLFDFDGVIADTFHVGHKIAQRMCVYVTETEYRKKFEGNILDADAIIRATDHGDRCDHALDWVGAYLPEFRLHARLFSGMSDVLKTLSAQHALLIVSSTHDDLIKEFLKKTELRHAVRGVYAVEMNPKKCEKFEMIFSNYQTTPKQCIFITDTLGDVNEAASVGLSSIGVTWGFQDRSTLERGKPFAIADSPHELPGTIERYFASA